MATFTHSDYIGNLVSSGTQGALSIRKFELNPGLASVFPWVAPQVVQYANYRLLGCRLVYEPNVGTSSSTALDNTVGRVGIRFQSDPTAPSSSTLLELENAENKSVSLAYRGFAKAAGPQRNPQSGAQLRVRVGGTVSDLRFYDFGYFEIWSEGVPATNVVLGKLRMEYSFQCSNTVMFGGLFGKAVLEDKFNLASAAAPFVGDPLNFQLFYPSPAVAGSNIGCRLATNELYFPSSLVTGRFKITGAYHVNGDNRLTNGYYGVGTKKSPFQGNGALSIIKDSLLPKFTASDGSGNSVFMPQMWSNATYQQFGFSVTVEINNPNGGVPAITCGYLTDGFLLPNPGNSWGTLHIVQVNSEIP